MKCYNSCRYKNYGCGCNNSTSCHKRNCVVSAWGNWSSCSKACGTGTQSRTRRITTNAAYGGTACPSNLKETRNCNTQCCPVSCTVSAFGSPNTCSKTCGGGTQRKMRSITRSAQCGGTACPALFEDQACNEQSCPVDCVVGAFGAWGDCSATCSGGKQTRTRSVTTAAAHGGAACPALEEEQECNTTACPTTPAPVADPSTPAPIADPSTPVPIADPSTPAPVAAAKCPVQLVSAQKFATTVKPKGKKKIKAADVDALSCDCETMCKEDAKYTFWYVTKIKKGKQGSCVCLEGDYKSFKKNKKTIKGAAGGLTEAARKQVTAAMNASRRRRGRGRRGRRN